MKRAAPHLLGAFVLLHLIAITLMSIPAPGGGMNRRAWQDQTVQDEFAVWSERISAWGYPITVEELEERLWTFSTDYMDLRGAALKPFVPYYRYTGSTQSWRMFVAPHRYPSRLEILVDEGEGWRTVYRARDPDADWLATQLDHDRMRSAIFRFAWPQYRGSFHSFARWLTPLAARDFPEAERLRVQFVKYRTATPLEVREDRKPQGKVSLLTTVNLKAHKLEADAREPDEREAEDLRDPDEQGVK